MTNKKKILDTALSHFVKQGINGSSTRRIALDAGVSEALIFKHFHFKDGLIEALVEQVEEHFIRILADCPTDPTELIQFCMELPLELDEEATRLWKFLYQLRWHDPRSFQQLFQPVYKRLTGALESLRYPFVEDEAELILCYIHGLAISTLPGGQGNPQNLLRVLRTKYVQA